MTVALRSQANAMTEISGPGTAPLAAANRHNIPAICRIPGRGTAFLVSAGLLMTSTKCVKSATDAARLKAVFFEGGKRERVEVALLPNEFFFAASFPEHLDYCVVACETKGIYNVVPVKLPLVQSEWLPVREGDTLLVVQHPIHQEDRFAASSGSAPVPVVDGTTANAKEQAVELKRFDDVLRRRDDLYYLKPNGTHFTAGCPVFIVEGGTFVGLQSQVHDHLSGDVVTSRFVSAVTIIKHLFANGRLARIRQETIFDDVWATWYVQGDTSRIVGVLSNFTQPSIHKPAALKLFDHASAKEHAESVVSCGGSRVIVECIQRYAEDVEFVGMGLKALWTVSFDVADNRQEIISAGGIPVILNALERFPASEDVAQFAIVLLYNITLTHATVTQEWAERGLQRVFGAMAALPDVEVIQKFGTGFFTNVAQALPASGQVMLESAIVEHAMRMLAKFHRNEYLAENAVRLVATLSQNPRFHGAPALGCCVQPVIEAVHRFPHSNPLRVAGNHALWGLGNDPRNRIAIFTHPDGAEVLRSSVMVVSAERPIE